LLPTHADLPEHRILDELSGYERALANRAVSVDQSDSETVRPLPQCSPIACDARSRLELEVDERPAFDRPSEEEYDGCENIDTGTHRIWHCSKPPGKG